MSLYDVLSDGRQQTAGSRRMAGVTVGVVTNNEDPDNLGRVRVRFPWFSEDDESEWARVASLMAGANRGAVFLPEVDDEVLVAFEQGDVRRPYVIGMLWNGVDQPPEEYENNGENNLRLIKTRSGHLIKFDDTDGGEKIEIVDKTGANSIVLDSAENTITITADKDIVLAAPQGTISLSAKTLELASTEGAKVEAGGEMTLEASSSMTVKGATVDIN